MFPAEFKVAEFPHLTLCHITRTTTSSSLIAYWRDESAFRAYETAFRQSLSLEAPQISGFVVDIKRSEKVWWKRID